LRYWWGDRNMPLPCFRIHGMAMFWGVEVSIMTPIKNLIMEKNFKNLRRM
jgi:hypothetical protein